MTDLCVRVNGVRLSYSKGNSCKKDVQVLRHLHLFRDPLRFQCLLTAATFHPTALDRNSNLSRSEAESHRLSTPRLAQRVERLEGKGTDTLYPINVDGGSHGTLRTFEVCPDLHCPRTIYNKGKELTLDETVPTETRGTSPPVLEEKREDLWV